MKRSDIYYLKIKRGRNLSKVHPREEEATD